MDETGTEVGAAGGVQVSDLEKNYFEEYGQKAQRNIVGQLLKFNKGDWRVGADGTELPRGKRMVAIMDQLTVGWVKWVGNVPEEQILGLVKEGFAVKKPKRAALGDQDQELWEVGQDGRAMDPWQETIYVLMKEPGAAIDDTASLYTFASNSKGSEQAVMKVSMEYGKHSRQFPGESPIVTLDFESYKHEQWGFIKKPKLDIVGWEVDVPPAGANGEAKEESAAAAPAKAAAKKAAAKK